MANVDVEQSGDPQVLQWKYTSSRRNIEQSTGFFTFSKSENLTDAEKNELVDKVAHYDPLESLPKRPTPEELKRFPVAFSYFRLSNGKSVLCRTRYVGTDYASSRYGNFFAHALILQKGDWDEPLRYFNSSTFSGGLTKEEIELEGVPEPLEQLALSDVDGNNPFAGLTSVNPAWLNIVKRIVDRFYDALKSGVNLVVYLDENDLGKYAAPVLSLFLDALPKGVRRKIGFCTYVRDATYEPLINARDNYCFVAFAPSTAKELNPAGKFLSVDLSNLASLIKLDYRAKRVYARRLTRDFLSDVVGVYPNLVDSSSSRSLYETRKNDLLYLNNLGSVDELLRGEPSSFDAVKDVWKFLLGLFLDPNRFEIVQNFVSTVLQNDYRKIPFARDLVREILAFSLRVVEGIPERPADVSYREKGTRDACVFWRNHIPREEGAKSAWRACVLAEANAVFGNESSAASAFAENGASRALENASAKACLRTFLTTPSADPVVDFLTIALGFRVIVKEGEPLSPTEIERLNELYVDLSRNEPWKSRIEIDFFETFAAEITRPETYRAIIRTIGDDSLRRYVERKFIDCPNYWRLGKGVPTVGKVAPPAFGMEPRLYSDDVEVDDDDQDARPTIVDARALTQKPDAARREKNRAEDDGEKLVFADARSLAQKTKEARQSAKLTSESAEFRSRKSPTRYPGADALVLWLVNQRDERSLELLTEDNLFGSFIPDSDGDYGSYKDFTHARGYFKKYYKDSSNENDGYVAGNWDSLENDWYDRVIERRRVVLIRAAIGLLLLIAAIVAAFFTVKYWSDISAYVRRLSEVVSGWFKKTP